MKLPQLNFWPKAGITGEAKHIEGKYGHNNKLQHLKAVCYLLTEYLSGP